MRRQARCEAIYENCLHRAQRDYMRTVRKIRREDDEDATDDEVRWPVWFCYDQTVTDRFARPILRLEWRQAPKSVRKHLEVRLF